MNPPKTLFFVSDGCTAELVLPQPNGKAKLDSGMYLYRYTKALENMNKPFAMNLEQIERLKSVNLLITQ
jgi:hypothetical protein